MTRHGRVIVYGHLQQKCARCVVPVVDRARKASLRKVEQVPYADREIIEVLPLNQERKQAGKYPHRGKIVYLKV